MNRQMETAHLAQADRHVMRADKRLAGEEHWIATDSETGPQVIAQAQCLLAAMQQTRQELLEHRASIVQRLANLDYHDQ